MNIRDILELLKEFCIFESNNINNFILDIDDDRLDEDVDTLLVHKLSENIWGITIEKYADDTIFRIVRKKAFSLGDEIILLRLVDTINKLKDSLSYQELSMILSNVQLDALLNAIYIERAGKYIPVFEAESREIIASFVMKMAEWSSQTYENHKLSFVMGMDPWTEQASNINVKDLYNDDMFKVMGIGRGTIIVCNRRGEIIRYEKLDNKVISKVPLPYGKIAGWSENKLAVILTLLGEILVFYDQRLLYIRHDSKWYSAQGSPIAEIMCETCGYDTDLNNALIDTCFDVSFRRCGACLGIVETDCPLIFEVDKFRSASTPRAKFFRQIVGNKRFQDLDREVRQALVGIDGATVMDKLGNILAIGAILMLNPRQMQERTTGGRSVAAQQLAEYGIGIKISEDGGVEAWRKNAEGCLEKIVEVM